MEEKLSSSKQVLYCKFNIYEGVHSLLLTQFTTSEHPALQDFGMASSLKPNLYLQTERGQ